jgi:hypothetical protein
LALFFFNLRTENPSLPFQFPRQWKEQLVEGFQLLYLKTVQNDVLLPPESLRSINIASNVKVSLIRESSLLQRRKKSLARQFHIELKKAWFRTIALSPRRVLANFS